MCSVGPIRTCNVCSTVFVQKPRRKPRTYCSVRCESRGHKTRPSNVKRGEYVTRYRKKKQQERETYARKLLQKNEPIEAQRRALRRRFPGHFVSNRAIMFLLNGVRRKMEQGGL